MTISGAQKYNCSLKSNRKLLTVKLFAKQQKGHFVQVK